jgi:hypothetical protein
MTAFLKVLSVGEQDRERVARDVDEVGCISLGDVAEEAVEGLQLHFSRGHRVVAVVVFGRGVGECQADRFVEAVRAHEPLRIRAHGETADARVSDEDVHA